MLFLNYLSIHVFFELMNYIYQHRASLQFDYVRQWLFSSNYSGKKIHVKWAYNWFFCQVFERYLEMSIMFCISGRGTPTGKTKIL